MLTAAERINNCYQQLGESNVVYPLLQDSQAIQIWQHYPQGDVKDLKHHTQYYFHSHPSKDQDRLKEHGHFHLFFRQDLIPKSAKPIAVSPKYQESNGKKDRLVHVAAIAMNEYGKPTGLFTVNHWVVYGLWYKADVLIPLLDRFIVDIPASALAITNTWITAMMELFQPFVAELLIKRDEVIADFASDNVFDDRNLEITSLLLFE